MRLFSRWKKSTSEIVSQNNKPIIIKNTKHSLFNDIIGYEDVKEIYTRMIIVSQAQKTQYKRQKAIGPRYIFSRCTSQILD